MLQNFFLVGIGGAVGAMCRFAVYKLFPGSEPYWITFGINILGSLIIGLVLGFASTTTGSPDNIKLLVATGICGGFTTFSAFSAENMELLTQQKYLIAFIYSTMSVCIGIAACFLGFKLTS